jgi:sugar lactone lactonase YvrE
MRSSSNRFEKGKMKRTIAVLLCGLFVVAISPSQETPATAAALNAQAIKAYEAKDYARFLAYEKQALALEPDNPRVVYNVACGESLAGNAPEAVRMLDQLLWKKIDLGAETDDDFAGIRKTPEWQAFQSRLSALRKPLVHSQTAFTLADPTIVATGIAVDAKTGDTYIASVRQRKIIRRTRQGAVSDFIQQAQDGFLAGDALAIDSPRHLLYATASAVPYMLDYQKDDFGRSGLFAFDLKSGKLVRKAMLAADGKRHILNQLTIDHEGNVYVSDTGVAGIYILRRGSSELESFIAGDVFRATQGVALSKDEKTLYVADYVDGLWAVDIASKSRRVLQPPAGVWLFGLDGLSRAGDSLISVQIGPKPERVLRIQLDGKGIGISKVEILEMSHPDYHGPIQGTVAGRDFVYVANSQLDLGNGRTGAFAADQGRATVVLRLPL